MANRVTSVLRDLRSDYVNPFRIARRITAHLAGESKLYLAFWAVTFCALVAVGLVAAFSAFDAIDTGCYAQTEEPSDVAFVRRLCSAYVFLDYGGDIGLFLLIGALVIGPRIGALAANSAYYAVADLVARRDFAALQAILGLGAITAGGLSIYLGHQQPLAVASDGVSGGLWVAASVLLVAFLRNAARRWMRKSR
jgi:hypothetical protein